MRSITVFSILAVVLPLALAHSQGPNARRHQELAKRKGNARFSFFDVGMGACGHRNSASQFVVALNQAQYTAGANNWACGKTISISYGGKTTTATIVDECPGCPYLGLDMSTSLFDYFAPASEGIIYGEWSFTDGSGSGDGPSNNAHSSSKHTTSTHKTTSTSSHHTTTSTKHSTTSHTSTSTTHTTTSTSSTPTTTAINYFNGDASGLAVPTGSISDDPGSVSNLNSFNQAIVNMGGLLAAARA